MSDTAEAPPVTIVVHVHGDLHVHRCDHGPELPLMTAEPRLVADLAAAADPPTPPAEAGVLFDPPEHAARRGGPRASSRTPTTRDHQVLAVLRNVGSATAADVAERLRVKATTADGYLLRLYKRGQVIRMDRVHGPYRYALARSADTALPEGWQRFR